MRNIIAGQILLILCCMVYLAWWYRGFRPGVSVNRVGGANGLLLLVTAVLGISGVVLCLFSADTAESTRKFSSMQVLLCGIIAYIALLLITRYLFNRVVTTELILIVGWTMLEAEVMCRLNAAGLLPDGKFWFMCAVTAAAFIISMVLYVAYYRMEEMKAFYAAMVPLITEAITMGILIGAVYI